MAANKDEILRMFLEQMPEGVVILDGNDEIIFVNEAAEKIRRVSKDEIIGRSVVLCHLEKSHERVGRALQFLRERGEVFRRVIVDQEKDRCYENTYAAIRDTTGNYIGAAVITRDITDRRKLEEEKANYLQNLEERVAELAGKFEGLLISSMTSLVNTLEAKDPYTSGHSLRVSHTAVKVAEHMWGVCTEAKELELAGKLHDIGKVGIREATLNKPGRLTEEEFNHIKEHPVIGERILMPIEKFQSVAKLARHHHERYDGMGYPDGLSGEQIPMGSRILALADAYDAMTSVRPYRSATSPERAAEEIKKSLGIQFDPQCGDIFLELFYSGSIG